MSETAIDRDGQEKNLWDQCRYKAFISYARVDKTVGAQIQKKLEQFKVPRPLRGRMTRRGPVPARVAPVFRDITDMDGFGGLNERVKNALEQSAFLVVLCSPHAAKSKWVNKEIESFAALGRADRIIPILIDGEAKQYDGVNAPNGAFPPALYRTIDTQHDGSPLAPDIRRKAEGMDYAILKTCAAIVGVSPGELSQRVAEREKKEKRNQRRIAAIMSGLAAVAAATSYIATNKLYEAEARRSVALAGQAQQAFLDERLDLAAHIALAALPDPETLLASPSTEEAEYVFRRADYFNRMVATLPGHNAHILALAADPTGNMIASGDRDGGVKLWSRADLQLIAELDQHDCNKTERKRCAVTDLAFSPDGKYLASGSWDETIQVWSLNPLERRYLFDNEEPRRIVQTETGRVFLDLGVISDIAFSPDGETLASASWDGRVKLLKADDGVEQRAFDLAPSIINAIAWSADGAYLAAAGDEALSLWNLAEDRQVLLVQDREGPQTFAVTFSPDGNYLAASLNSGAVILYDTATGEERRRFLLGSEPMVVRFAPDSSAIFISDEENALQVYRLSDFARLWRTPNSFATRVFDAAYTEDGKHIATVDIRGRVALRDYQTGEERWAWRANDGHAGSALFIDGSREIVTAGESGAISIWNGYRWNTSKAIAQSECDAEGAASFGARCPVAHIEFSPDGSEAAVLFGNGSLGLLDPVTEETKKLITLDAKIQTFTWIDDDQVLATTDNGALIRVDTNDQGVETLLTEHSIYGRWKYDNARRALVAINQFDGLLVYDNVESAALRTIPNRSDASFCSFDVSRDGSVIATLSSNGEVVIYETETLSAIFTTQFKPYACFNQQEVVFNADATSVAAGTYASIKVWDIETGDAIKEETMERRVSTMFFRAKGDALFYALSGDGNVYLMDFAADSETKSYESHSTSVRLYPRQDGVFFSVAGYPGLNIFDEKTMGFIGGQTHLKDTNIIAYSPSDDFGLLGAYDGEVIKFKTPRVETGAALSAVGCASKPPGRQFTAAELDDPMLRGLLTPSEVELCN